jgi:hypothetical protein
LEIELQSGGCSGVRRGERLFGLGFDAAVAASLCDAQQ